MKKFALIAGMLVAGANAFALDYFNCTTGDSNFLVVESEVWGTNPVGCSYNGEALKDAKVKITEVVLLQDQTTAPNDYRRSYLGKATITASNLSDALAKGRHNRRDAERTDKDSVEEWVICTKAQTPELDLVAPTPPCEVDINLSSAKPYEPKKN